MKTIDDDAVHALLKRADASLHSFGGLGVVLCVLGSALAAAAVTTPRRDDQC